MPPKTRKVGQTNATQPPSPTTPATNPPTATQSTRKPRAKEISWAKNPHWTQLLIAYLQDHDSLRLKLFSDSSKAASSEDRKKHQAKEHKQALYAELAEGVFGTLDIDNDVFRDYHSDKPRFATSVGTHLAHLKKTYTSHCKSLGKTGAGLDPNLIEPGSDIANKQQQIISAFPFWESLHGFWQELPNYNPHGVLSSIDADSADRLQGLLTQTTPDVSQNADFDAEAHKQEQSTSVDSDVDDDEVTEIPIPASAQARTSHNRTGSTSTTVSTPSSSSLSTSSTASTASSAQPTPAKGKNLKRGIADVLETTRAEQASRSVDRLALLSEVKSQESNLKLEQLKFKRAKLAEKKEAREMEYQRLKEDREHQFRMRQLELQIGMSAPLPQPGYPHPNHAIPPPPAAVSQPLSNNQFGLGSLADLFNFTTSVADTTT